MADRILGDDRQGLAQRVEPEARDVLGVFGVEGLGFRVEGLGFSV